MSTIDEDEFERRLLEQNIQTAQVLGTAVEMRDYGTEAHCLRVVLYAGKLGEAMGLDTDTMRALLAGAFLHDVGKIGIPDRVLLKPGRLTDDEFDIMRRHSALGADLLDELPRFRDALPIVRHHHERYDGTGYPDKLRGEEIPVIARAFTVVDVFDALMSARPYKPAMSLPAALRILEENIGSQLDPYFTPLFIINIPPIYKAFEGKSVEELKRLTLEMRLRHFGG